MTFEFARGFMSRCAERGVPAARAEAMLKSAAMGYPNRRQMAVDNVADFVKDWEKFRPEAYWDDVGKKWTYGYGETEYRGTDGNGRPFTRGVREGDAITEPAASELVDRRLGESFDWLGANIPRFDYEPGYSGLTMTPDAQAMMMDLHYNGGPGMLMPAKSPRLNRALLDPVHYPDPDEAVMYEYPTYVKSNGKVSAGLANRRAAGLRTFMPGGLRIDRPEAALDRIHALRERGEMDPGWRPPNGRLP